MGDLNANVGVDNTNMESIMGKHGIGTKNENCELLSEFCMENNLIIGVTIFSHKDIQKVAWTSPDHVTQNQIGHITISRPWRKPLMYV